jgi:hypothetical protein
MENLSEKESSAVTIIQNSIRQTLERLQRHFQAYCIDHNVQSVPIAHINTSIMIIKDAFKDAISEATTPEQEKIIAMDQEDFPTSEKS